MKINRKRRPVNVVRNHDPDLLQDRNKHPWYSVPGTNETRDRRHEMVVPGMTHCIVTIIVRLGFDVTC